MGRVEQVRQGASPAGGEGDQPAAPSREVGLLDLPDDVLRLVAGCVSPHAGDRPVYVGESAATHLPLLLTCRRLAAIGYTAVTEVRVSGSDWEGSVSDGESMAMDADIETAALLLAAAAAPEAPEAADPPPPPPTVASLLASPAGQHLQRRLFSVRAFLRRVAASPVRRLVVADVATGEGAYDVFWALLRGATAHLPIRDVTAGGAAVAVVAAADVSAVPLTCLRLEGLDARCRDTAVAVGAALAAHGPGLTELRVAAHTFGPTGEESAACTVGFASSLFRDVPAMPALRALVLCISLCGESARRMAAACPAVETLVLEADCGWLPASTGVCWPLPHAFPRLRSLTWESSWDDPVSGTTSDLLPTLRGRSLERLSFAPYRNQFFSDDWVLGPPLVDALSAATALPAVLKMDGAGAWTAELLAALLVAGTTDTTTLRDLSLEVVDLSAATMAPLGRLSRLSRLSLAAGRTAAGGVTVPAAPCLADLSVMLTHGPGDLVGGVAAAAGAFVAAGSRPWGDTEAEELAAALLTAAAASAARATLATLRVHSRVSPSAALHAAAVAAAPRLAAFRHLTVGRAAWSFARGRVVGRFVPDPDPPILVRNVLTQW